MAEIAARARAASNAIRSHSHPILETGNLSYPNGFYAVDFRPGDDQSSFRLVHRVEGAPLISRLLEDGTAKCICTVSAPISTFRKTLVSETEVQTISWDIDQLGEPPLFTPMIVSMGYQEIVLDSERDGAHSAWDGATVKLLKGSRLAVGPVIQLQSSPLQMIVIVPKPELAEGVFFVQPRSEPPFRFEVNVSTKLHAYLQRKAGELRPTIMTHIVTGCFRLLQHSYSRDSDEDGGWRSDRSLLALSDFLEERGLGHWSDDDFRPEQAATSLYPLTLPEPQEET